MRQQQCRYHELQPYEHPGYYTGPQHAAYAHVYKVPGKGVGAIASAYLAVG